MELSSFNCLNYFIAKVEVVLYYELCKPVSLLLYIILLIVTSPDWPRLKCLQI